MDGGSMERGMQGERDERRMTQREREVFFRGCQRG